MVDAAVCVCVCVLTKRSLLSYFVGALPSTSTIAQSSLIVCVCVCVCVCAYVDVSANVNESDEIALIGSKHCNIQHTRVLEMKAKQKVPNRKH